MTEDFLKKTEEVENSIFEIFGNSVFASFIHLLDEQKISKVWKKAVAVFTKRFNSLKGEKAKLAEKLLKDFSESTKKVTLQSNWRFKELFDLLYSEDKEKHPHSCDFLISLLKVQLLRFEKAKQLYSSYALKSTLSPETVRLKQFTGEVVKRPEASLIVRSEGLLTDEKGNFNLAASSELEKKENNIKATLTSYSVIPQLQEVVSREITKISGNPIIYSLYKTKTKRVIWAALKYVSEIVSKFLYAQMERGITPREARENTMQYFRSLPDRDKEMELKNGEESLWLTIRSAMIDKEKMNPEDNQILFMDTLESIVYLCRSGIIVSNLVFKGDFRIATSEETEMEGNKYSYDLIAIDQAGEEVEGLKETYAVVYDPEAFLAMFTYATLGRLNSSLYGAIKKMNLIEKLDNFAHESVSDFLENQTDYSVYFDSKNT